MQMNSRCSSWTKKKQTVIKLREMLIIIIITIIVRSVNVKDNNNDNNHSNNKNNNPHANEINNSLKWCDVIIDF